MTVSQRTLDRMEVVDMPGFWRRYWACPECIPVLYQASGCTPDCRIAMSDRYLWHGVEGERPTNESIIVRPFDLDVRVVCWKCGAEWWSSKTARAYGQAVHARAVTLARAVTGDFDEEAERSRLRMVPA